ncbi:MAG: T9SS type A sorting domain-containing protein [Bacteroidales bacterium]|nr:T9SS type A sorting domain-containing protein [Bacteroidales bacterium]
MQNVRLGAEAHGRVFANMYDMSGGDPVTFVQDAINDWKHLVDDVKILESPNYIHHNGRPVLSLWGVNVGNSGDILTAAQWLELVTWFTVDAEAKYQVTLKAGVGNGWRGDSEAWQEVYDAFDIISPWAVGRYRDNNSADIYRETYFQADLDETASRDMEYIPVVFPGFSWMNLKGEGNSLNSIPRNRGEFLWHQMYNAIDAGCNMVYVAMFDEVDEGTAIFKTTENASQIPTTGTFLTLDADGLDLPSDWYLRLTGEASKMLRGEIELTPSIPISPYPNTAKFISQDVSTQMSPGEKLTVSVSMENTGTTSWTKAEGYKLGSIDPENNLIWGINRIELEDSETIDPGDTKTFTFDITAPTENNIYRFQWKMIQEGEAFFGEKTKNSLINVGSPSYFLDDCDALTAWGSSGSISLNNADQKQGDNCIEFNGSSTNEFQKVFSPPYNSGIPEHEAVLQFWYYTSDASKMSSSNQVEIGSSGTHDQNEYNWSLTDLITGWNLISLKFSDAAKTGNPDLNAINWFRLYNNKTGTVTTRIDEIQILDFNASVPKYELTVNSGNGNGFYIENARVDIMANPARDGYIFNEWLINSGSAKIADIKSANTVLTILTSDVEVTATYKLLGFYLDDCDAITDWESAGTIALNGTDNKEGANCIEFNGMGTDEYKKSFSSPYNSGIPASNAVLQFWYYISDVSLMGTNNQLEIGSAGRPDQNEYNWNLSGLSNGWNLVQLKITDAASNGEVDLNAINWFRYYNFKSGNVTSRIDAIEIIDPDAGEKYTLVVNNGSGTGAFYSNSELTITADAAPAGQEFDEWVIISGNPTIADINAATTTLTMPIDGAEITATYKEAEVSVGQYTSQEQSVNIYPNPLSGRILSIDLLGFDAKDRIDVKITNLMGQTIYSNSIQKGDHLEIDANSLFKNGIYLVNVKSGQSIVTKKLIVE